MNPVAIATAIATLFASEAIKAGGESFGEGASKTANKLIEIIRDKLKSVGTEVLLSRVQKKATKSNISLLKSELLNLMEDDKDFSDMLSSILEKLESSELKNIINQSVATNINIGNFEAKDIQQEIELFEENIDQVNQRSFGISNIENLKIENISQRITRRGN